MNLRHIHFGRRTKKCWVDLKRKN